MSQDSLNNPSKNLPTRGDPTKVSSAIQRIISIIQTQASFEMPRDVTEDDMLFPINSFAPKEVSVRDRFITALVEFQLDTVLADADGNKSDVKVFSAASTIRVIYELDSDHSKFSDDDLHLFLQINVVMNAVPYWREFVHSATARAGLPCYEVPIFNFARMVKEALEEVEDGTIDSD